MLLKRRESHKRRKNLYQKIFGGKENKDLTFSLIHSIVSKEDQVSNIILLIPSVGTLNKYVQATGKHLEFYLSEHTE